MLLGVALHAALSFIGIPWAVQDSQTSPLLGGLVAAVHGFRMPLFFLLSGFFTAMLWRKRGLGGLLRQRGSRILIPLIVGCFTIVPLMWVVIIVVGATSATYGVDDRVETVWKAAATGDLEALQAFVTAGGDLNTPDPLIRQTPLAWAVTFDQMAAVDALLVAGADPMVRFGDQHTAMHTAAFFGRVEAVERLLAAGAEVSARNAAGETPLDSMRHGKETTEYIAGILKVEIDFEEILAGRHEIRRMLVLAGAVLEPELAAAAETPGAREPTAARSPWAAVVEALLGFLMLFPFFHHLWFLWFLCWLVAGFALVVMVLGRLPIPRLPCIPMSSPGALLWLVPLTMVSQSMMHEGGAIPGFGPDTSAGLLPIPHVLAHHAIFFGFGAVAYLTPGAAGRLGRGWWIQLPLALAIFPAALALAMRTPWGYELASDDATRRLLGVLGQSLFAWLMIFGSIGLFERLLSRERPWVRYISDSSYWLYLTHLPLVIVGQAMLRGLPLPALLKFTLLVVASMALLLASYQLLVRHTFIGLTLNGRR